MVCSFGATARAASSSARSDGKNAWVGETAFVASESAVFTYDNIVNLGELSGSSFSGHLGVGTSSRTAGGFDYGPLLSVSFVRQQHDHFQATVFAIDVSIALASF